MKNPYLKNAKTLLLFFMFTLLFFAFKADAQCPSGNVSLTTQAQVNQFLIDYPNCTQINGYLDIGEIGSDINVLAPLANITTVTKSLGINHTNITNNNGFELIIFIK